ncbi:MAG: hypothetical protein RJQ04_08480 [Longimicrobiales bacterium]
MVDLLRSAYYAVRRRLRPVKAGARRARDLLDRTLHPRRHRAARRLIADLRPGSIVFVCLGNVCRSPYAEWTARPRLGPSVEVSSAGFIGPDRAPPDTALDVARARGVDHGASRSTLVTQASLAGVDLAVVFDAAHGRRLRRMAPVPVVHLADVDPRWWGERTIVDPWGKESTAFEYTFDRIDSGVGALARLMTEP